MRWLPLHIWNWATEGEMLLKSKVAMHSHFAHLDSILRLTSRRVLLTCVFVQLDCKSTAIEDNFKGGVLGLGILICKVQSAH